MIHYNLIQDSTNDFGAHLIKTDPRGNGLYLATWQDLMHSEAVGPESKRSNADYISTSGHMFAGDTNCSNLQVEATLAPLVSHSSLVSTVGYTFDGGSADYLAALRAGSTHEWAIYGHCFFSITDKKAYVPPQDDFGFKEVTRTPKTGYECLDERNFVYSWVPFGEHFAVIKTSYFVTTYLPKYPQLSSAQVRVSYLWTDISEAGVVSYHESTEKTVLSASGSVAAISTIKGYALLRTSDPTNWAADALATIPPINGRPFQIALQETVTYDPRAMDEFFRTVAHHRVSKAGIIAASNSLQNEPSYDAWADLADTAIDSCKFTDINAIAYARDLRSFGSELKSVLSLMANPMNPKKWASLYLGLRYGTRLTVSDTNELVKGIKRCSAEAYSSWNKTFQTVRSRKTEPLTSLSIASSASRQTNYKVYYRPNDSVLRKGLKALTDWDIFPTTQNLWDLVPFSFVADWFVNIQQVCETLDRRAYEEYIDVLGCTYSYKDEYVIPVFLENLGFENTDVVVTVYHRRHSPAIHQSALRLTAGHLSSINVIDGFSLLLQGNRKR